MSVDILPLVQFCVHWLLYVWDWAFSLGPVSITVGNWFLGCILFGFVILFVERLAASNFVSALLSAFGGMG